MSILFGVFGRRLGPVGVVVLVLLTSGPTVRAVGAVGVGTPIPAATPEAEGYAHPEWLAEAGWLAERLGQPKIRVVALTPAEEFGRGHIPGAVQVDWPELELTDTSEAAVARWRAETEATLTRLGLRREETVVVYDGGTLFAARLWWVLRQLGHADVRVLNGGLPAWTATGGEVETGGTPVGSAPTSPYRGTPDDALLATTDEVEAALGDPAVALVDARGPEEYAAGHIPGAVHLPFTDNALPDAPRRWKPAAELRAMYAAAGITPDRRAIPYCTTGVRSAVTAFTLALLGYDVALFTGSWAEWSADPTLPRTTGSAP